MNPCLVGGVKQKRKVKNILWKNVKYLTRTDKKIEYVKILTGTIEEKLKIARIFQENYKKFEEMND